MDRETMSKSIPCRCDHCAQLDNFLVTDIYLGATSIILPRPEPGIGVAHHRKATA